MDRICQEILQFLEGDFVKPKNKDEKRKFGFELVEASAFSLLRKFSKLRKFGHLDFLQSNRYSLASNIAILSHNIAILIGKLLCAICNQICKQSL